MTDKEMKALIEELIELQFEESGYIIDDPEKSSPRSPATKEELKALEDYMAKKDIKIPPSYRQFLSLFNGIENFRFMTSFSLRSIQEIIDNEKEDSGWDFLGSGSPCKFVIGRGDVISMCSFDPDSVDEGGEMKVLEFDVEGGERSHENFEAFLRHDLEGYKQGIAYEKTNKK